ncbi:hypothetical protein BDD12DRAFT_726048 [Trichophaea hybrida]|nr:hypothetical protein BDD12DRAFT_726048 [Trichophaea hybrida]
MITNIVNDLAVLCPNRELGCTATLPRSLVSGHLKDDCRFVTVDCPGCEEKILRSDLQDECMHNEVECSYCLAMIRRLEMQGHEEICPQLRSSCPHCLQEFPRPDIRNHQLACEEGMVVCKALSVGCPWSGRRRDASEHAISCAFTYLQPLLHEHASRIAVLELENKLLRKKIDVVISRINSEQINIDNGLLDGQTIQILTEQEHIRSDLERLFAAIADMNIKQSMLTMHMSDNMRTRDDIAMIGAAVSNLRSQLHGLQLLTLRQQSGAGSPTTGTSTTPSLAAVGGMLPIRRLCGRTILEFFRQPSFTLT